MVSKKPLGQAPSAKDHGGVVDNPWRPLRAFTDARIGLGRAGVSIPTAELLAFQLAHAQAQDAVHLPLDVPTLCHQLAEGTLSEPFRRPLVLHSQAADRMTYLQRPDLGRRLDDDSRQHLQESLLGNQVDCPYDLAVVIVDGLSSRAIQDNALPFLQAFSQALTSDSQHWRLAPLTVVEQGRVAIGDEVGERLNANAVLVMVGERPGLSSPDSLGLYLTWGPREGLTDAHRNCISNVRPAGLKPTEASLRLLYLLTESRQRKLSGVQLKDRTEDKTLAHSQVSSPFRLT
ncbi:ethanolamine ammonia-lyase subunit EutC [Marinobacter zhejiangensis]|uniref:Ethanolamine ammonia-lyase small subunit n=1 Tax=Marinobacter zhejiangensis TaxID=488535 RepID=A0A1I4LIR3_9GAMM|nr:ethanolamine ammonia-lyase subunit EutC [Marinobacter zhejiangensis]SFL90860.1 Ethanolamine ammonia-lyase light chain [Marinobacter zhejiangensis]